MRKRANKFIVMMLTLLFYEVACAKPNAMWSTPYAEYGAPLHVSSVWTPYVITPYPGVLVKAHPIELTNYEHEP